MLCENLNPTRRAVLGTSGALFAWAFMPRFAHAAGGRDPRFVTIILRGALDGIPRATLQLQIADQPAALPGAGQVEVQLGTAQLSRQQGEAGQQLFKCQPWACRAAVDGAGGLDDRRHPAAGNTETSARHLMIAARQQQSGRFPDGAPDAAIEVKSAAAY